MQVLNGCTVEKIIYSNLKNLYTVARNAIPDIIVFGCITGENVAKEWVPLVISSKRSLIVISDLFGLVGTSRRLQVNQFF